jgi:hypothetical protein
MGNKSETSSTKKPSVYVSAGAAAGFIEAAVVHPLDMIKTRHQLNSQKNESILKSARSLLKEGGVPRLYRCVCCVGCVCLHKMHTSSDSKLPETSFRPNL